MTGSHAPFGTEAKIGIELAVKHINDSGGIKSMGGIPLELVVEDAGGDADSARLGAESIISKHHPSCDLWDLHLAHDRCCFGSNRPRASFPDRRCACRQHHPDGTPLSLPTRTKSQPAWYVRSRFVMEMAEKQGLTFTKVAIINEDSAFGRANTMGALDEAINWGLTTVYQKEYPYDITDATTIINDIENSGADFIVHCPYFNDAIVFANGFSESNKIPKFIAGMGACGYTDPQSIEQLGDNGQCLYEHLQLQSCQKYRTKQEICGRFQSPDGIHPNRRGRHELLRCLDIEGSPGAFRNNVPG